MFRISVLLGLLTMSLWAHAEVKVVASFSVLADLAKQVGQDRVEVVSLIGPDQDAHAYQSTPQDAIKINHADLLLLNGLGFDEWVHDAAEAADFKGHKVVVSDGLSNLIALKEHEEEHHEGEHEEEHHEHHGDDHHEDKHEEHGHHDHHHHGPNDPHAWHSPTSIKQYVNRITEGLIKADPASEAFYQKNEAAYLKQIDQIYQLYKDKLAELETNKRYFVTSHDAFGYLAQAYNLKLVAIQGISTDSETSAQELARLIKTVRAHKGAAFFIENVADPRLLQQVVKETGGQVGGTLYAGSLSKGHEADTYLKMHHHNMKQILEVLEAK